MEVYLNWQNDRSGTHWSVDSEPDPPEAIIRNGEQWSWVEVAGVYPSGEWAHDVWSAATPGEAHHDTSGHIYERPTATFAEAFIRVVRDKRRNAAYLPYKERYGQGILLLDLHSPWLSDRTIKAMEEKWAAESWCGDLGCFREIYLVYVGASGLDVAPWRDA